MECWQWRGLWGTGCTSSGRYCNCASCPARSTTVLGGPIGVQYLESVAPTLSAPWSLAWAILALAAYGRPIDSLYSSLVVLPELTSVDDTSTLALVCLALDYQRALSAFGVTS